MCEEGIVVKMLAGFYYVESAGQIYECKARGILRKKAESPLVGDRVQFEIVQSNQGVIDSITPRLNFLVRPPVANIDRLFVVVSLKDPAPNTWIADKAIANAENKGIEPVIVINKTDLGDDTVYRQIYEQAGFKVFSVSAIQPETVAVLKPLFDGKICAFTGNSGAGKSSILNALDTRFSIATGDISQKLGRGRHTTRHVELYKIGDGYVADTPGFSNFDMDICDQIRKENLQFCFREFTPFLTTCKFTSCSHTKEKGCKIIEAVEKGIIPKSRHESYCRMYQQASEIPDWEFDKKR